MGIRGILERARGVLTPILSKLPGLSRRFTSPGVEAEPGIPEASGDIPAQEINSDGAFPGFAPPPGFKDRVRGALASLADGARRNPRVLAAAGGTALALAVALIAAAVAFRPPEPVSDPRVSSAAAVEILRSIPVPRLDPLAEDSALDRPRKDRYTEADVSRLWIDLGQVPREDLRERNRSELWNILAALERP